VLDAQAAGAVANSEIVADILSSTNKIEYLA
jgi:hypothetical protein